MSYVLSAKDIDCWAKFSGDRNPIHFSQEAAVKAGIDKPFAHGMLAMLKPKQEAATYFAGKAADGGLKFDFKLRTPVFLEHPLKLLWDQKDSARGRFELKDEQTSQTCIYGAVQVLQDAVADDVSDGGVSLPVLTEKQDQLTEYGSLLEDAHPWIQMESLAFASFIYSDSPEGKTVGIPHILQKKFNVTPESHSLLHTHHGSRVTKAGLALCKVQNLDGKAIRVTYEIKKEIDQESRFYVSLTLRAYYQDQCATISELGLLFRES